MFGIFPEFWSLLQDAGRFYLNLRSKSKTPVGNHFRRHGTCGRSPGSQTPGDPATPGSPRRRKTLHRRGLEKSAHTTPFGRVRKMAQNAPKKPPTLSMTESEAPPVLSARTGMLTTLSVNATATLSGPGQLSCTTSVNNLFQGLHCGISLLWHYWNVRHSVEELNRGTVHVRVGPLEHKKHHHRDVHIQSRASISIPPWPGGVPRWGGGVHSSIGITFSK